jgi:triacylglycerol esterase/lipase EstA (alpha/beta hydrolase family)
MCLLKEKGETMISSKTKGSVLKKWLCVILVLVLTALPLSPAAGAAGSTEAKANYPYVFVAGYAGWGHYDKINETFQYWGMRSGDLLKYLNGQGFECYAASVDPVGSAWDRACELYAQLTGTVVDYGRVHSALYKHSRFGTDYSKDPLITGWGSKDANGNIEKVNFVAHSFGGATVRLLAQLLAKGSPEERSGTVQGTVSSLFTGGKPDWIYSITTVASPHNGTTVYNLAIPLKSLFPSGSTKIVGSPTSVNFAVYNYVKNLSKLLNNGISEDTGAYDLSLDGAAKLNKMLTISDQIYYFSFPTDATAPACLPNKRIPDTKLTDIVFLPTCLYMSRSTGVTAGGIVYDKTWLNNDGIVNTVSAKAPKDEPQQIFDANSITKGTWNIMKTFKGDHASITGGVIRAVNIDPFYLAQLNLINSL